MDEGSVDQQQYRRKPARTLMPHCDTFVLNAHGGHSHVVSDVLRTFHMCSGRAPDLSGRTSRSHRMPQFLSVQTRNCNIPSRCGNVASCFNAACGSTSFVDS
jgi:hypothetical protein